MLKFVWKQLALIAVFTFALYHLRTLDISLLASSRGNERIGMWNQMGGSGVVADTPAGAQAEPRQHHLAGEGGKEKRGEDLTLKIWGQNYFQKQRLFYLTGLQANFQKMVQILEDHGFRQTRNKLDRKHRT